MRRIYVVVSPFKVCGEDGNSRTVRKDEYISAEAPLGRDQVVVYLDNLEFSADRSEFDASTLPIS
jgi:hypothetical protein